MVDIESEYATHRRKIMTGIDGLRSAAAGAATSINQVVQVHARQSLSKKLPAKLFSNAMPAIQFRF